jgi:copper transport protein
VSWYSLLGLAFASLAQLVLQASIIFERGIGEAISPSLLGQVITNTGFGASWLLQVGTTAALLIVVFYISRRVRKKPAGEHIAIWWTGLIASAVLLLAPTWTGHAAAAAHEHPLAKSTDWLHLFAGGLWIGGLFHLALTMPKALSSFATQQRLLVLHRVIPRFTRLAVASTVLIAVTGVYNSWLHIDRFGELWDTPYGKTLLLKVLLVIPMLVLGGVNTFIIHPRASRFLDGQDGDSKTAPPNLDRSFYRSVRIEAAFGVAVLLVASVLVFLQPAREHVVALGSRSATEGQVVNK